MSSTNKGSAKPSKEEASHDAEEGSNQAIKMLDHAMAAANANDEEDEPDMSRWQKRAPTEIASAGDMGGRPASKVYVTPRMPI